MRLLRGVLTSVLLSVTGNALAQIPNPEILYYTFDAVGVKVPNHALAPPAGTDSATVMGGLTTSSSGQCGAALIGSGNASSTDYLDTGWPTNIQSTAPWTISVWTSGFASSTTLYYIFGDATANSFRCFTNGIADAGNWILRGIGLSDVYVNGGASVTPSLTTFVFDPATSDIKGYLDGMLVTTVPQGVFSLTSAGPFKVMGYGTNVGAPAGGLIDEFRLYSRALSAAEVLQLYTRENTSTVSVTSCGDYTSPSGNDTWTTSGTYTDTIPNMYCGDSILTINLTVNQPTASAISPAVCHSFTGPSGTNTWTASGTYTDTIPNSIGCDSVITVNLTILQPTFSTISPIACGSYTSPGGQTWTIPGTYMDTIPNAAGCDSVITINLAMLERTYSSMTVALCFIGYVSPSGHLWLAPGIYSDTIPNSIGCDSVITVDLIINYPSTASISVYACGSYTAPDGAVYTTSGGYGAVIPNAVGCDSTIYIDLHVHTMDTSLTLNGTTLTANQPNVAYQWIDCSTNQPIAGATAQSFTPTALSGSYAVQLTDTSCTFTSGCWPVSFVGLPENTVPQLSVFPNPVASDLQVANPAAVEFTLEVYATNGQLISTTVSAGKAITIAMGHCAPGVYLLKARTAGSQQTFRIIRN